MRDMFSLDGPLNKYGGFLADTMVLSFFWILFSLPVITIGASTTAMFYVSTRRLAEREGHISGDFWAAFKANFGKATKIWLALATFVGLLIFNVFNVTIGGTMGSIVLMAQYVFLLLIALVGVFIFPMTARFDMSIKEILKSSFYMGLRHILTSITCVIMLFALLLISIDVFNPLLLLAPGIYAMGAGYMVMRVFKKYRPEMDKDPMLELQEIEIQKAEDRRNRGISVLDEDPEEVEAEA